MDNVYNIVMQKRLFLVAFFAIILFFGSAVRTLALTDAEQEAQWRADLAQTKADIDAEFAALAAKIGD